MSVKRFKLEALAAGQSNCRNLPQRDFVYRCILHHAVRSSAELTTVSLAHCLDRSINSPLRPRLAEAPVREYFFFYVSNIGSIPPLKNRLRPGAFCR